MTNYNSGFNSGFNPNIKQNINPVQNPKTNPTTGNNANTGANYINPYVNAIRQSFIMQNAAINTQNNNNMPNEGMQNKIQNEQNIQKTEIYNYEKVKMDSEALLKYLQNVMKMPENINKLITALDSPIIKALVEKKIDIKILSEIMKNNSSEAVEKVLKAISESIKSGIKDVSQLKDIFSILNTIQNSNSSNVLKELLLLYIPVNPPIFDKNIDFKSGNPEEEQAISSCEFCLIFETVNFSNISCCINNNFENTIYIQFFANKNFPFEKFKKIINTFKTEMNIRVEIENKYVKRIEDDKPKIRNFNIISNGYIPCNILILAHLIIKTIFKIDETFNI